jgi:hypothetical protein
MAKQGGMAFTTLSVDLSDGTTATDIRNDVTDFDFSTPRALQDVTGVDKSAIERIALLADFSINLKGIFNATGSHLVFKTVSSQTGTTKRTVTLGIASVSLANECLFSEYALQRSDSAEFTWSAPGVLADGAIPTWA